MVRELRDMGVTRVQRQPLGVDVALFHPARRDAGWRAALGVAPDTRLLSMPAVSRPERTCRSSPRSCGGWARAICCSASATAPRRRAGDQVLSLPPRDAHAACAGAGQRRCVRHVADQEAFGATTLEAMACGTPAVVRAAGALPELVDGGAGVPVRSDRIDEWAEAITALFAAGRDRWSAAARARALEHDWERAMPALSRAISACSTAR